MPHLILVWFLQSPKSKVQTSNEWRGFQILMKQTFYNNQNKYHLVTNHHVASHKITTVNFHKNPTYKNTNNFPTHQIKLTYTFPHLTSSLSSDFNPHFIFLPYFSPTLDHHLHQKWPSLKEVQDQKWRKKKFTLQNSEDSLMITQKFLLF